VDNRPVSLNQKQNKELHGIDAARHDVLHKYEEAMKKRKRLLEEQQALESKLQGEIARCNQARKDGDYRLHSMMDHMSIDRIHMGRVSDKLKKNQKLLDELKEEAHSGGRSVWRDKHVYVILSFLLSRVLCAFCCALRLQS
jgi:septation ring formation regulator EzrA